MPRSIRSAAWLASLTLFGLAALPASGAVVEYSQHVTATDSISTSGSGERSVVLTRQMDVPQFDPALGTLTGVKVSDAFPYTLANTGIYTIGHYGSTGTASVSVSTRVGYALIALQPNYTFGEQTSISTSPSLASINPGGGVSSTFRMDLSLNTPIVKNYADTQLAGFVGTGDVSSSLMVEYYTRVTVISGVDPAQIWTYVGGGFDWTRTITYTYTPSDIPEPASLGILAAGALLVLRRRRAALA